MHLDLAPDSCRRDFSHYCDCNASLLVRKAIGQSCDAIDGFARHLKLTSADAQQLSFDAPQPSLLPAPENLRAK
jgi:hypothetical protein